jgi:heme/copper-type cytochrome/quinol oxidase subunit 3
MTAGTARQYDAIEGLPTDVAGSRSPGWWAMILVIMTEATLFASFLASYFYLQSNAASWPPDDIKPPELLLPIVGTIILIGSSLPMWWADRSIARGNTTQLRVCLILGFILGVSFLGIQVYEYAHEDFGFADNTYSSLFFTITGAHGLHVLIGLVMNAYIILRAFLGHFSARRRLAVQNVVMYWHFVDAAWIFVFASLYLSPRWL